jgi:hypothetical protein
MEITLPDGRKATVLNQATKDHTKIRLEDGREVMWPTAKLTLSPKEGEDTLKVVVTPAIDRLEEFSKDFFRIVSVEYNGMDEKQLSVYHELIDEAFKEFNKKWGLI